MTKVDYGIDSPKMVQRLASRAIFMMAFAAILYAVNRGSSSAVLPLATSLFFFGLILAFIAGIMLLSSRVVKLKVRDQIIQSIPWKGDEDILDVGCGRGLFLVGAAKRLKTGKATGVDIWQKEALSGNSAEAALANAKAEGVEKRVKIQNADARSLPFSDNSFDVVLSSLALHNIQSKTERAKALAEVARVMKTSGYLVIFDILFTREYAKALSELDFKDIRLSPLTLLWCVPTRTLTARKA